MVGASITALATIVAAFLTYRPQNSPRGTPSSAPAMGTARDLIARDATVPPTVQLHTADAEPSGDLVAVASQSGAPDFGVPECDVYFRNYTACIDSKVPEATRVMIRQQLEASKARFMQVASTPEGRLGLVMACKQADDASRVAMQAYGCSW